MTKQKVATIAADEIPTLTLMIYKIEIPVSIQMVEIYHLSFYAENPRIYSLVRAGGSAPSQEDIYSALKERDHVKQLMRDIKANGGLIDPIIVRSSTMDVLEGNSRLAAYRMLAEAEPIKWGSIKAMMLPESFNEEMVFSLLNQYHLKGKAKWDPFERAGFVYRRWTDTQPRMSVVELSRECVEEIKEVKLWLNAYRFMLDYELEPDKWSYAYEYIKSNIIGKAREETAGFDAKIVSKIKDGTLPKATDVRDKLRDVCKSPKVLKGFLADSVTLDEAYAELEYSGAISTVVSRIKNFNDWIYDRTKLEESLARTSGPELQKLKAELRKLCKRAKRLEERFLKVKA